jgi:hypothetical protein
LPPNWQEHRNHIRSPSSAVFFSSLLEGRGWISFVAHCELNDTEKQTPHWKQVLAMADVAPLARQEHEADQMPSASTITAILVVRPPRDLPMA